MVYKRFIHPGSVVYVNSGKYDGKLVVVADIVDHARALCENPVGGIPRQVFRFQHLNITDLKVNIPHGARGGAIRKQYIKEDIDAQWEKTSWGKRLKIRSDKKALTDFGRFEEKIAKQQKNRKIKAIVKQLRK